MRGVLEPERVFVYGKPVDMRKSFDGLFEMIARGLQEDPLSGDLFLFINRRGNYLKGLLWDRTGFLMLAKRLEQGQFRLRNKAEKVVIERDLLRRLLDGIPVGGTEISRSNQSGDGSSCTSQTDEARGSSLTSRQSG